MKRRPKYRIYIPGRPKRKMVELGFDNKREAFDAASGLVTLGHVPTLVFCYQGKERRVWMVSSASGQPLPYNP